MRRARTRALVRAVSLLLILPLLLAVAAKADDAAAVKREKLVVRNYALNTFVRELDGQWLGNLVASDGNVYFFSSTHSGKHGAAMFQFDPRTKEIKMLCEDISRVCGEDPTKNVPQGKVHSAMVEANGWLYFGTHLAEYTPEAEARYTGGHVVGYELATGQFRDYGIVRPRYTIYAGINVDAARKLVYVYVTPFAREDVQSDGPHLYRIHLDTGAKEDLGRLTRGRNACYSLIMDYAGNCWLPQGEGRYPNQRDALFRARPESATVDAWYDVSFGWAWAESLPDGKTCVFANRDSLMTFDMTKSPNAEGAVKTMRNIGVTNLGMTMDANRVYYMQRANRLYWSAEGGALKDQHLFSASLVPNARTRALVRARPGIIDHGLLTDQNGRWPWKLESLSTDGKGHIYIVGAWHVEGEEEKTLGVWKNDEGGYCGQFFGEVDLSADIIPEIAPMNP